MVQTRAFGTKKKRSQIPQNENWHRGVGLEHSIHLQYFSLLSAYSLQRYQLFCGKKKSEREKEGGREGEKEREGGRGRGRCICILYYVFLISFSLGDVMGLKPNTCRVNTAPSSE